MTMKVLAICGLAVGFVSFVMGVVGLCTNNWRTGDTHSIGLWKRCEASGCNDIQVGQKKQEYFAFETIRGFGILAVAMAFAGMVFGIVSLIKTKKIGPSVVATFYMMGALFSLICASVFTSLSHSVNTSWGYSFILTWIAFPLSLIAGVMMIVVTFSTKDDE
ncbi:peripheral myelin protein 22-like [Styela clava]|uniref:peripheral myelin protein 22-like n=1 Tax=Styela clava TaxID=7725 RepID=UPI00193A056B|nr:peripheral myelin protein 22-like [Styela clava]